MKLTTIILLLLLSIKAHSQCGLYSINVIWEPNERNLVKVDDKTAQITKLTDEFIFEWYITDGGVSVDGINNIYYIKGTEYEDLGGSQQITYRLYGIDMETGKVATKPKLDHNDAFHQLLFNCMDQTLYGIEVIWEPNERYLVKLDPTTGKHERVSPRSAFDWYLTSAATAIDPFNNRYYAVTHSDNDHSSYYLTALNLSTGLPEVNIKLKNSDKIHQMVFNCADNTLYAIEVVWDPNERYLVKIDPETGEVTRVSPYSIFEWYETYSGVTINPETNSMFLIAVDNNNQQSLIEIDLTSGLVTNTTNVKSIDPYHQMRTNCKCKPFVDFNFEAGCAGSETAFKPTLSGGTISWDFGDPESGAQNTSTEIEPTHTYEKEGIYDVKLKIVGCGVSDSIIKQVTILNKHDIYLGNDTLLCPNETITLDAGIAINGYLWSTGDETQTLEITKTGLYSVIVDNGCKSTGEIFVEYDDIRFSLGEDFYLCSEEETLSAGIEGVSYLWSDGSEENTLTATDKGTYSLTVTSTNCSFADTINIQKHDKITIFKSSDSTMCNETPIVLDAGLADSHTWQDNSNKQTHTVFQAGQYWVDITKDNCMYSDTINIKSETIADIFRDEYPICDEDTILILPETIIDAEFHWPDGTISPFWETSTEEEITVEIQTPHCTTDETIIIAKGTIDDFSLGNDTLLCYGESIILKCDIEEVMYSWNTGSDKNSMQVQTEGLYFIDITNEKCSKSDSIFIDYETQISIDAGNDTTLCPNERIRLLVNTNADSTIWLFNNHQVQPVASEEGIYTAKGSIGECFAEDSKQIHLEEPFADILPSDTTLCHGDEIILQSPFENIMFILENNNSMNEYLIKNPGLYIINTSDGKCTQSETIEVHEDDCSCRLYVPNALSLSHSSKDVNTFNLKGQNLRSVEFTIFDEWGNTIYYSNSSLHDGNPSINWDGTNKGGALKKGHFFFTINAQCQDENQKPKSNINLDEIGSILLLD